MFRFTRIREEDGIQYLDKVLNTARSVPRFRPPPEKRAKGALLTAPIWGWKLETIFIICSDNCPRPRRKKWVAHYIHNLRRQLLALTRHLTRTRGGNA